MCYSILIIGTYKVGIRQNGKGFKKKIGGVCLIRKKAIWLLGIIVLTMFLFIHPIKGNLRTVYVHHICDIDTYIEEYYDRSLPTSSKLQVGCHYISFPEPQWESYFFFNFSDRPENITKAEIRISLVRPDVLNPYNFSIDVYLIEEYWNQFDIKWSNRPNRSDFIRNFDTEYITDGNHDYLLFDITKYANRNNISICLTPSLDRIDADNHVYLYSREYFYGAYKPRVIWTCQEYYYDDIPPSISIIEPFENQIFNITPPSFNIYIVERLETGINSQWYTLDYGISNYTFSLTNFKTGIDSYGEYISADGVGMINQDAWNNFGNSNITVRFYVKDGNGNIAYEEVNIIKNAPEEPEIDIMSYIIGFGVGGALVIIGFIGRFVYNKRKKSNF